MMKVRASIDYMGCLTIRAVSEGRTSAYLAHLASFGIEDASVFIQNEDDVATFIAQDVPRRYRADLRSGWDVTYHVDPWVFGHWIGWDCHEIG